MTVITVNKKNVPLPCTSRVHDKFNFLVITVLVYVNESYFTYKKQTKQWKPVDE